jgi:hypothetical protein
MNESSSAVRNTGSGWHHPNTFVEGTIRQRLEKYRHQPPEKQEKSHRREQNTFAQIDSLTADLSLLSDDSERHYSTAWYRYINVSLTRLSNLPEEEVHNPDGCEHADNIRNDSDRNSMASVFDTDSTKIHSENIERRLGTAVHR